MLLPPHREANTADPGNLHSEVERLAQTGIPADRRGGRARLLRAGRSAPIDPLANLLGLGSRPKPALERTLTNVLGIEQALIGGH